jgi:methylmalonyl-CoA carboxyltransferase small subunit
VKYKLTVDGKTYEVDIEAAEQEAQRPALSPVPAGGSSPATPSMPGPTPASGAAADESKVCRSPIAGVVVKVTAQAGQTIQANDVLVVLEAMKMETTVTSPVAGKVAKVNVAVGDSVQSGQIVVEFE